MVTFIYSNSNNNNYTFWFYYAYREMKMGLDKKAFLLSTALSLSMIMGAIGVAFGLGWLAKNVSFEVAGGVILGILLIGLLVSNYSFFKGRV
jgi:hypothetical protein